MGGDITMFADLVEANGRTVRENNLARPHAIPIGALVEFSSDESYGGGAASFVVARKFVVAHTRDCDGSPLYALANYHPDSLSEEWGLSMEYVVNHGCEPLTNLAIGISHGHSEEGLRVVEATEESSLVWVSELDSLFEKYLGATD